jgi:hypothetical protein
MIDLSEIKEISPFEEWAVAELKQLRYRVKELETTLQKIAKLNNERDRYSQPIDTLICDMLKAK